MSYDELYAVIRDGLYVYDAENPFDEYKHRKGLAEYLERAVYVCPECGFSTFHSEGNFVECKSCGLRAEYLPNMEFRGVNCDFPFRTVSDWYDYQYDFVNKIDTREHCEVPIWRDRSSLSEVVLYKKKLPISEEADVELYGDRIVVKTAEETFNFDFAGISAASVLGKNKLNIYYGDKVYQFKGDERFNALKFVNIYYRNKNIVEGVENGKFLGL